MTHVLGWRGTFGVLAPSTNTVVEADYNRMAPPGITPHQGRITITNQAMDSDEDFVALLEQIRAEIDAAALRVMSCEPDAIVMGMSAETFWGGVEGNKEFIAHMLEVTGMRVTTGAEACDRALKLYGARKVACVTPYQPVGDEQVHNFFTESGYDVLAVEGLKCPTAVSIARVPEAQLLDAITKVNTPDVDAIIQVGTNLSMVRLADEAQRWLGKPVIAINAATWWMALRDFGIDDKVYGAGDLLENH